MDGRVNQAIVNGNVLGDESDNRSIMASLENSNKKTIIDDIVAPSELKFDEDVVENEVLEKKRLIESCLSNSQTPLEKWQMFAKSKGGLISDDLRCKIWPILVGVTQDEMSEPPTLAELSDHIEYHQVVLDVNRSLKRFPPGIPYEQRVALQDQLTVLILRVIMKYPSLKYYQGYHDVAITLLLVCGEIASFPLLCRLSQGPTAPLEPFMQLTMQPAQHLLNYLYPLLMREHPKLGDFLQRSTVGTIFALPWFVTWFGHSLNRYTDVVRLYDYFLCSPPLFPIYVTAAIVLHRQEEILDCDCDMATVHCLLSKGRFALVVLWLSWIVGGICGILILLIVVYHCCLMPKKQPSEGKQYNVEQISIRNEISKISKVPNWQIQRPTYNNEVSRTERPISYAGQSYSNHSKSNHCSEIIMWNHNSHERVSKHGYVNRTPTIAECSAQYASSSDTS